MGYTIRIKGTERKETRERSLRFARAVTQNTGANASTMAVVSAKVGGGFVGIVDICGRPTDAILAMAKRYGGSL